MTITARDFAGFVAGVNARLALVEQELNAADARIGDGDTGSMLARVVAAMAAASLSEAPDLSQAAMRAAQAALRETGSSLGTLVATAVMVLAKEAKARGGLSAADMADVVARMRDAVAERGQAAIGDKTVIDSLDAIAAAFADAPPSLPVAATAARRALDLLRDQPCRIGRARMFPEKSKGADDPGMLAVSLLLNQPG